MNRDDVVQGLRWAQADFHQLVDRADREGLRRRSDGTRWTKGNCCGTWCSVTSSSAA